MSDTSKKAGYLRGLLEGAGIDESAPQGKLIAGIIDLLGNLSERADIADEMIGDLNDYVESIDDDLSSLEDADSRDSFSFDENGVNFDDEDDFEEDMDFEEDPFENRGERIRLLSAGENSRKKIFPRGGLCPECSGFFLIVAGNPDRSTYKCPHCGKAITPVPPTPENTPTATPIVGSAD